MTRHDKAQGRYLYLTVAGVEYRVYYEQTGSGIPVLLQHTAGVDGRQWRHLLEDDEISADFRLIAYDLPYHGRSLPPISERWWADDYRLTQSFFTDFILGFSKALELDRPVFLGASLGGYIAVDLALRHPEAFRAIIGCEVSNELHGLDSPWFDHPRISDRAKAAQMYDAMGPQSPEALKRESTWLFAQAAPPVMLGDLYYVCTQYDMTGKAESIRTDRTPLYLFNGEYDWVMPPSHGKELADRIKGARFEIMPGLGHFPMIENPAEFRKHILPVLREIKERSQKI
jgi:pimeloyl-ACP methyl ester carboxylesterase